MNTVHNNWGAEIIDIPMSHLTDGVKLIRDQETTESLNRLYVQSKKTNKPSERDIIDNIRVYLSMKKIVDHYDLDAITVRCFDLISDLKMTGCLALSHLNDDGIIAGCEGDLVSTLGMLYAYRLTGIVPWMANPSRIKSETNSVIFAHCTVPCSIINGYTLRSHFESGIGVGIQGTFPPQDVTILRIGGKNLNLLWCVEGTIIKNHQENDLCRTQVEVRVDHEYNVTDLLRKPLGNHHIILRGHLRDPLLRGITSDMSK